MLTGFQITISMSLMQQNYDHIKIQKSNASSQSRYPYLRIQRPTNAPLKLVECEEILLSDKLRASEHVWTWEDFDSDESVCVGRFNLELV